MNTITKYPLVSIIIRTMNRPELLSRAIDSVYSQTYPNIEIVVVNDGGEDVSSVTDHYNNLEISDNIIRNIKYIVNKSHKYRAGSGNVGIRASGGEYIGFLDDDDYYFANHVSEHIESQEKNKSHVSISMATESIEKKVNNKYVSKQKNFYFPEKINRISLLFFENYFPFNSIIFRKDITKKIGFLDEERFVLEDWDFIIRIFLNYEPSFVKEITCEFTSRGNATNIRNNFEYQDVWKENFLATIEKYRKVYKKSEVSIPISEVSGFLSTHAAEWYQTSISWRIIRDSYLYRIFNSKPYSKMKKVGRIFGLTRG